MERCIASTLTEEEQLMWNDYDWALHDPGVRHCHAGKVIAVYSKKVLGVGCNHSQAAEAARQRPDFPVGEQRDLMVLVAIP